MATRLEELSASHAFTFLSVFPYSILQMPLVHGTTLGKFTNGLYVAKSRVNSQLSSYPISTVNHSPLLETTWAMDGGLSGFPSCLSGSSLVSFVALTLYQMKGLSTLLPPQSLGLLSSLHIPSRRDLMDTHGLVVYLQNEDFQISISSSDIPPGSWLG